MNEVIYCRAEEEIPMWYWNHFKTWMNFREYHSFKVKKINKVVYHPHQVKEFKMFHGLDDDEIMEDIGELETKLEFTD